MDLVTMVLACSLYSDNSITNAMVQVGSQNKPLTVATANASPMSFTTPAQAAQYSNSQMQQGNAVAIGLMQIPSLWLKHAEVTPTDLFLPCKNMVFATKVLNNAVAECSQNADASTNVQACALSMYKTGDAHAGLDYANTVLNYASSHPFSAIEAAAEAKNPAGFHMIPGDAPTTASTPNASKVNPATDPDKIKRASKSSLAAKNPETPVVTAKNNAATAPVVTAKNDSTPTADVTAKNDDGDITIPATVANSDESEETISNS